jgi:hypothetical protein
MSDIFLSHVDDVRLVVLGLTQVKIDIPHLKLAKKKDRDISRRGTILRMTPKTKISLVAYQPLWKISPEVRLNMTVFF